MPLPPLFVQLQFRLPGCRPLMGLEVRPFSALDEVALGECGSLMGAFHIAGLPKDHSPDSQESRVSFGSDSRSPAATSLYQRRMSSRCQGGGEAGVPLVLSHPGFAPPQGTSLGHLEGGGEQRRPWPRQRVPSPGRVSCSLVTGSVHRTRKGLDPAARPVSQGTGCSNA